MLKKYTAPHQLQYVGKAWEIRHALRQEQKRKGGHTALIATLPSESKSSK
jgi:hypothetical protein